MQDWSKYMEHKHCLMIAREVYILRKLTKMESNHFTIKLVDLLANEEAFADNEQLKTLYLVTNFEEMDMNAFLHQDSGLDFEQFIFMTFNLLLSLNFLHQAGIIHRDLAPKNVLINDVC